MIELIQIDLFDFEDTTPTMVLPSLAELQKPKPPTPKIEPPPVPTRFNYRITADDVLCPAALRFNPTGQRTSSAVLR